MNITELLRAHAFARPEAVAILDARKGRGRSTSYAGLELASARAAALLLKQGLRPGDAVLVFHPMSAELYIALIALFRLKLLAMVPDPSAGRDHLEQACAIHAPKALIASPKAHLLRLVSPALRAIPRKFVIGSPMPGAVSWAQADHLPPFEPILPCEEETPALLAFTSGSTGQPKATLRTHGFLLAQHRVLQKSMQLGAGEINLTTLPIFVLSNLATGITSLIPNVDLRRPGEIAPASIIAQIQAHRVTSATAAPAFLECLARYCARHCVTLPSLTKIFAGGGPIFPRLLGQLHTTAPQADLIALYGSTEAEPIAQFERRELHPEDLQAMLRGHGLLAGKPVEGIQLRILPNRWGTPLGPYTVAEFSALSLPPAEPGEIVVTGGHVLPGYWQGQGDSETKFRVEDKIWHRTGDAGYLDPQGRLWLLGRCGARIDDAQGTLYPFAAECSVYQNPNIRRAAVVGLNGRRVLGIELYDPATSVNLNQLGEAIPWVDEIRVLKCIPVDNRHNAKIHYPSLYKLLEGT